MRPSVFWRMFAQPRMVGWLLLTALGIACFRWVGRSLSIVPGVLGLDPGLYLALAAGMYAGPAGVFGAWAGSWGSDLLFGDGGAMAWFRSAAFAGGAWAAAVGWTGRWEACGGAVRFVLSGAGGCLAASVWQGFGADASGLYSYGYILIVALFFQLGGWMLVSPALFVVMRAWSRRFDNWRELIPDGGAQQPDWAFIATWVSIICAAGLGTVLNGWETDRSILGPAPLGLAGGPRTWLLVSLGLLFHLAGLLGAHTDRPPTKNQKKPSHIGALYLPPLE